MESSLPSRCFFPVISLRVTLYVPSRPHTIYHTHQSNGIGALGHRASGHSGGWAGISSDAVHLENLWVCVRMGTCAGVVMKNGACVCEVYNECFHPLFSFFEAKK